jgi:hypothetical protein
LDIGHFINSGSFVALSVILIIIIITVQRKCYKKKHGRRKVR